MSRVWWKMKPRTLTEVHKQMLCKRKGGSVFSTCTFIPDFVIRISTLQNSHSSLCCWKHSTVNVLCCIQIEMALYSSFLFLLSSWSGLQMLTFHLHFKIFIKHSISSQIFEYLYLRYHQRHQDLCLQAHNSKPNG